MAAKDESQHESREVLIVEDSPTQAEQLKHLLELHGHSVVRTGSGAEALEAAHNRKPMLVISDILMPGMDGYELCREIKSDEELKDLPVVLVTSLSAPHDILKGLEAGADNFIRKPYDEAQLLARIDYIVANRDLRATQNIKVGVEISFGGGRHLITAERQQILDLLISTYDEAVHLSEGLNRVNLLLNGLYRLAEGLNGAASGLGVCEAALERALELPGVRAGWISLLEGESAFRLQAVRGLPKDSVAVGALERGCQCHQTRLADKLDPAANVFDCYLLKEVQHDLPGARHHASIPLWVDNHVLGIMNLVGEGAGVFTDEDLKMLHSVGNQVGIALERARLREHLERMVEERTAALTAEIAERRRAQESQARLAAILEATTDLVGIADKEGRVMFLNRGGRKLIGFGEEEDISGFSLVEGHAEWARSVVLKEAFPAAIREGVWHGETALLSRDGREIPVSQVILSHKAPDGSVEFLSTIARDITDRKKAEAEIQSQLARLGALRAIDRAITSSMDLHVTLGILLEQVTGRLAVDAADVLLLTSHAQSLECIADRGFRRRTADLWHVRLGEGLAGHAAFERRTISSEDLAAEPSFTRAETLTAEDFRAYYAVPLVAKGQVKGVLEVFHRSALDPSRDWLDFMEALAGQAAIAIDNSLLFANLQRSNDELVMAYDATIEGWSRALDLRDKETEGHTQRVTELSVRFARLMGFSESELVHVRRGALLHDIGKMGIPDRILLKPGSLTEEEWEMMRKHPTFAYEMLSPITYLRPALDIPYCHHEKWDGTGYPRGLVAEQIPLSARLFAAIDVWDALRSDRPYRAAWPSEKVLEHIRSGSGSHFDPRVVEAFPELVRNE